LRMGIKINLKKENKRERGGKASYSSRKGGEKGMMPPPIYDSAEERKKKLEKIEKERRGAKKEKEGISDAFQQLLWEGKKGKRKLRGSHRGKKGNGIQLFLRREKKRASFNQFPEIGKGAPKRRGERTDLP